MNTEILSAEEQPLRIKEVAAWLGISAKTVRRRIDSGDIQSVKMGGLRVVTRRKLKEYWEKLNGGGNKDV